MKLFRGLLTVLLFQLFLTTELQRSHRLKTPNNISIDIVYFEKKFWYSVDECTTWSEIGYILMKSIDLQISVFRQNRLLRHDHPQSLRCDCKYENNLFKSFCEESDITLLLVPANDHKANGLVEYTNRPLRSFIEQLCQCNK